jgi:hypothetical protein
MVKTTQPVTSKDAMHRRCEHTHDPGDPGWAQASVMTQRNDPALLAWPRLVR